MGFLKNLRDAVDWRATDAAVVKTGLCVRCNVCCTGSLYAVICTVALIRCRQLIFFFV